MRVAPWLSVAGCLCVLQFFSVSSVFQHFKRKLLKRISPNSILQDRHIEVHKQTKFAAREPEVRKNDCLVYWGNGFDGLELYDRPIAHKKVQTVTAIEFHVLVDDGKSLLSFERDRSQDEFSGEAFFISRFQQSGAESLMNLDRSSDDGGRECRYQA